MTYSQPAPVEGFSFEELEDILFYFSTSILEKHTEEEILWDLVQNCISRLRLEDCVIYLVNEEDNVLEQKAAHGPKNPRPFEIFQPIVIPLGKGITGSVAQTGKAEIIPDTRKDPRYLVDDQQRLSEIAVPIKVGERVIGVIDCEHSVLNFFTAQHSKILHAIAAMAGARLSYLRAEADALEKQQKLTIALREAADLRVRALRAQMNPHFVFNALNAIQHFIVVDDKRKALSYLSVFSKMIRDYLKYLDQETIRLSDESALVKHYLTLQKLRYESRFDYNFTVEQAVGDVSVPALVIQLFIEELVEKMMLGGHEKISANISVNVSGDKVLLDLRLRGGGNAPAARGATYRDDLPRWKDHADLLNRIRKYNIVSRSLNESGEDGAEVQHQLFLPVI